jgi:hypothetical protein
MTRSMMHTPALRALLAVFCGALLAAGCGIPVSDQVEVISPEGHEELLFGTTTTTEPVPEAADPETTPLDLFFIGPDNKLERVTRPFTSPKIIDVLSALENPPLPTELELFEDLGVLESRVPEGLSATGGGQNLELGIQRIDVNPEVGLRERLQENPEPARLIVAQLVCTILNLPLPDVSGVEIFDGQEEALQLSDTDAEPITGPATLVDFDGCKTGTEERLELLEEGAELLQEETTTTTAG